MLNISLVRKLDDLDMVLLYEMANDGSVSIPVLAKKMGIHTSVIYSRIKRLVKKKLIKKFTIVIDDSMLGIHVKAMVGIKRDPKQKESIHEAFMEIPEIISVAEVTGRFDMLIRVHARDLESLHTVVMEKIGKIEGVQTTETLVELQKTDKDPAYLKGLSGTA